MKTKIIHLTDEETINIINAIKRTNFNNNEFNLLMALYDLILKKYNIKIILKGS